MAYAIFQNQIGKMGHFKKMNIKKRGISNIQGNKTIHFYRNYFLSDSECPQTEDPHRNFGSPKQIREKIEKTNHDRLFGATQNLFGGTQNPRENDFYKNGLFGCGIYA